MKPIEFIADKIKIHGPKVDGSYSVTLEVGEYEQDKLAKLMNIKQPNNFMVTVKAEDE